MLHCKQAIVVEGRYDKNMLRQLVDAPVFETSGFGIFNDRELLCLLRTAARTRGLIVLTDADGAGFVIRNYLKSALSGENLLHAYIPPLPGKERRKTVPGKEGLLGVEGMTPEIILNALRDAGAELDGEAKAVSADPITKTDLFALGFSGRPGSSEKRDRLLAELSLPRYLSANALLEALNLQFTREEFLERFNENAL